MNPVIFVWLLLFLMNIICVSSENFFIVTNHSSDCPSEISGEPCLTLNQYVARPIGSLNVTLTFESGNHFLTYYSYGSYFYGYGYRNDVFVMTAQSAKIIYTRGLFFIRNVRSVEIRGITFTGSSAQISVYSAQEVHVYDCHFQNVRLELSNVGNATFVRCTFSNYISYFEPEYYYDIVIISRLAVLSFYNSKAVIVQCNFTNNEGAINFEHFNNNRNSQLLSIIECTFANNTPNIFEEGVVALFNYGQPYYGTDYFDSEVQVLMIMHSVFVNNTSQYYGGYRESSGGAIYLRGRNSVLILTGNKFINNSANRCGALCINTYLDRNNITTIMNNSFYYNKARSEIDVGGGAMCISNTSVVVTNSTFVGNSAKVDGGAILCNNSTVTIIDSYFSNNTALRDGGALAVNVYPSNFTITDTCFMDNQAGDDGGAIFVGRKGSQVRVGRCSFINNHATDRGGAHC